MAFIIHPDRYIERVYPRNGRKLSLEEAQKIVGGYIQLLFLDDTNEILVFNKEGKLNNLPFNSYATTYARCNNALLTDNLVGNVILCKPHEILTPKMTNELLTPFERQRLARNKRIVSLYEEKRKEYPFISNLRIYKMISAKEHLTHDTIRLIIKAEGKEIPKRPQV